MYKRSQVFAAACIGLFLFGITFLTLGSILPLLTAKFETKGLNTGALVSILPIGVLVGSVIFGPIVDRYGYKRLLIISILVSAASLQALAFTQSLSLLYTGIFFIGLGGGILNGGTNALVADITTENKAASLSLLGVSFGIGALGMPLLLGVLSNRFLYTSTLSGVGFFMLLLALSFLFISFPVPKQEQGFPLKEGLKLLKQPVLLLNGLFLFFQSGVEALSNNWTTTYLQHKLKITNEDALYALSFSVLGLTVARLLLGSLLKTFSSFSVIIVSLVLIVTGNILLMNSNSYNMAFTAVITTGLGLAAGFPVILGYVGQLFASLSGTAFSIALVIALLGNTILNYLFGWIAREYSVTWLPAQIIVCALCMFILLLLINQKIKGKVKI
jgi:MFS transporter, FHS family, glucose/mannose:H+ symporter